MLIAIDHGNRLVKGVHFEPFISGLVESEVKPFGADVLIYREKYYQISDQRIPTAGTRRKATASLSSPSLASWRRSSPPGPTLPVSCECS